MRLSIPGKNGQSFSVTNSDSPGIGGSDDNAPKAARPLRLWPVDQKRRIVEETCAPGASVSVVARRHDVNANLVFDWRKKYRQGKLVDRQALARAALPAPDLIRVGVVDHGGGIRPLPVVTGHSAPPSPETEHVRTSPGGTRLVPAIIEIELRGGIRVRVDVGIDESALRRVLAVIRDVA
jgi:transposase